MLQEEFRGAVVMNLGLVKRESSHSGRFCFEGTVAVAFGSAWVPRESCCLRPGGVAERPVGADLDGLVLALSLRGVSRCWRTVFRTAEPWGGEEEGGMSGSGAARRV